MDKATEAKAKPHVDFILSAEGQKIVEQVGYVPLN
jgi:phosphate transport system substrate-binding protein